MFAGLTRDETYMRVLIIEDEFLIRDHVARILRAAGYQITEASNGRAALLLMRSTESPDLILLDLIMPVMNGVEFRAEQVKDPALAAIPIIIISANADHHRVFELGAAGFIGKPVDPVKLLALVASFRG